jgi:16S rRNA processing protein RimM
MTPPEHADLWVWLAIVRRPQGRKGEVFAEILTDFPERFSERKHLWLLAGESSAALPRHTGPTIPREVELVGHWLHKGGIVLHFSGVDSISQAETLAGQIVAVPRDERTPLAEDEVYIGDLIGCTLYDVAGPAAAPVAIGVIENVDRTAGPVPLLMVGSDAGEVLIPFAKAYLRHIDLVARRIEMALPEGLADLNSPENG